MKKTPSDPSHENGGDFATKPYQAYANLIGSKFDGRSFKEAAMGKSCSQKGLPEFSSVFHSQNFWGV